MTAGRKHARYSHVYAIVRIDLPVDESNPKNTVAIVKVISSEQLAEAETDRLNQINADKSCLYFTCITRMVYQN